MQRYAQRRTEIVEYIKEKWQEYIDELYTKDLHDPDNHNAVTTMEFSKFAGILSAAPSFRI